LLRGTHGEDRRRAAGGRGAMQSLVQALLDRADNEAADGGRVAKAHFGFRRVDVDVNLGGLAFDKQSRDRMPVRGQEIEIGAPERAGERLVPHGAPVDEQELLRGVRPAIGRQAHPAREPSAVAVRLERDRIRGELIAQRLPEPPSETGFAGARGRPVETRAQVGREGDADLGRSHRQALDRVRRGQRLGPVGLEELEPRRRGGEQVARLDPRAEGRRARLDRAFDPVLDQEPEPMRRAGVAGADLQSRHRGDRGQRLAAEAERGDLHEVAVGNFRCRVPFDAEREIGFVQPMPVIDDPDEPAAAGLDRDLDRFRAGVERVLDQFLDRRRRPLDHLARCDAVDGQGIETANRHGPMDLAAGYRIGGPAAEGARFRRNRPAGVRRPLPCSKASEAITRSLPALPTSRRINRATRCSRPRQNGRIAASARMERRAISIRSAAHAL